MWIITILPTQKATIDPNAKNGPNAILLFKLYLFFAKINNRIPTKAPDQKEKRIADNP